MTYKELLDSVSFDEIVPYISKYHGDNDCLVLYKIHYDMLQSLTPDPKKAYYKTATVDYYESEDGETESYLHVHPIEGQIWEGALSMELAISPNVKESLAEIAACCLWHTSFYGFTDEDLQEYFNRLENGYEKIDKEDLQMYIQQIEQAGGHVPLMSELPNIRIKAKNRCGLRALTNFLELPDIRIKAKYRKRIELVSKFISGVLPQETDVVGLPIDSLCELYRAKHCLWYMLQSYSRDSAQRMSYIKELIEKYNAFCYGILENAIVVITTSEEYPLLMAEMELLEYIAKMCDGEFSFMVKIDAGLKEEMKVDFLFYEYEKEQKE